MDDNADENSCTSVYKTEEKKQKKRRPVLQPCKSRPTDKVKLPAFLPTS